MKKYRCEFCDIVYPHKISRCWQRHPFYVKKITHCDNCGWIIQQGDKHTRWGEHQACQEVNNA